MPTLQSFTLNGQTYLTDRDTMHVLSTLMPGATVPGVRAPMLAVLFLGQQTGRIIQLSTTEEK